TQHRLGCRTDQAGRRVMSIERVTDLVTYLHRHPNGVTKDQMATALHCSSQTVVLTIQELRDYLGDIEGFNLVGEPDGASLPQGQWKYRLVSSQAEANWWMTNRHHDAIRRLKTLQAIEASIEAATDGRTTEGREARLINRALTRLIEDIEDI